MDKSLRIKANILEDKVINVNLTQDVKTLEILSLNLLQENFYKLHQSENTGVVVGRVLANDAFGIPNAKVSVFISLEDDDSSDSEILNLYPYTSVQSFDKEYRKYNLLPDETQDDCYKVVGTFPNKRLVLDNDTVLEVYDKYWKYTTVTNNAGDYMIFGIPTGNQEIHVDIDLSDIGVLSQKPRDMLYKGYNIEQFDSPNQFRDSTNLNNLSQIISQNQSLYVYPFWGDTTLGEIAISRCDINVDYKFETTCVFIGSLITDNVNNKISHNCSPSKFCGFNRDLIAAEGTIEMIRKSIDGMLEDYQIKGNRLIDSDGVWCYQIPMNLDYVQTDEYGNIVPTDNPNKGIATRARVRFRIGLVEPSVDGTCQHRARYLVPNNPTLDDREIEPYLDRAGAVYEGYYEFGSATPENCFRNLYWNKVYTVKSFIPRIQNSNKKGTQLYTGIRSTNLSNDINPFPFNKLRFKIYFSYRIICLLLTFIVYIVTVVNTAISAIDVLGTSLMSAGNALIKTWILKPVGKLIYYIGKQLCVGCIAFEGGLTDDTSSNTVYYPGCNKNGLKCSSCPETLPKCTKNGNVSDLTDTIQQNLSQEYDTVNLDFYNDWINGCLYFPLWYLKRPKKKKYRNNRAKFTFCDCEKKYKKLRNGYLCALKRVFGLDKDKIYDSSDYYNFDKSDGKIEKWDTNYRYYSKVRYGVIKKKINSAGLEHYYYSFGNVTDTDYTIKIDETKHYVRLFSTDIVLLGSFNECDLDGIPKFFRRLTSTTANVPFLTKVTEPVNDEDDNTDDDDEAQEGSVQDDGTVVISGMDWLHDGSSQTPKYSAGLLLDLSCTSVNSRLKTNVNVERMSELGVGLDISHVIPYSKDDKTLYETVSYPDGLITRYEINDAEGRYMFASLNHFGLEELVKDTNTNYDVYKLGSIYPNDFDGMLTTAYEYTKASTQPTYDNFDSNYVEFRLGTTPHAYLNGERTKDGKSITYQPLYNNSYYFYFGLNDGNTAIDRFNSQYDSICYKTSKYPFRINYTTIPATWCHHEESLNKDYASINVELIDITTPYSYSLKNDEGIELFSGFDIDRLIMKFGYENDTNLNGTKAFVDNKTIDIADGYKMENGSYILTVTDSKGKSLSQVIEIAPIGIEVEIEKNDLGTKYYGYNLTHIEDICNDDKNYGEIKISTIYVDGYKYKINKIIKDNQEEEIASSLKPSGYKLKLEKDDDGARHVYEYVYLYFTVNGITADTKDENLSELDKKDIEIINGYTRYNNTPFIYKEKDEEEKKLGIFNLWLNNEQIPKDGNEFQRSRHNCGCQKEFFGEREKDYYLEHHLASETIPTYVLDKDGVLTFNVWIPTTYTATFVQYCGEKENKEPMLLNDNISNNTVEIKNGKPFVATLDTMPILFMISGGTDFYYSDKDPTRSRRLASGITTYSGDSFVNETPVFGKPEHEHYFFYDKCLSASTYSDRTGGGIKHPHYLLSWFEINKINMLSKGKDRNISQKMNGKTDTDLSECLYYLPDYTKKENIELYTDYISTIETDGETGDITDDGILTISQNLLSWVFELSKQTYSVDDNNSTHKFKCQGGKSPLLTRTISPMYNELANGEENLTDNWVIDSYGSVTVDIDNPDIVGFNFSGTSYPFYKGKEEKINIYENNDFVKYNKQPLAFFNYNVDTNVYEEKTIDEEKIINIENPKYYLSSYFAAFTKNGGFKETALKSGKYEYDKDSVSSINTIPLSASVITDYPPNVIDKKISLSEHSKDILGDTDYTTNMSYFPAPFIDRRFDYDLMLFTFPNNDLKISGSTNIKKESVTESVITKMYRMSGITYNGIEMSYDKDDEYNIFDGQISDKKNLEYTHEDGKCEYYYNTECIKNGNIYYPKYYETLINGYDITDYFYSKFSNNSKDESPNIKYNGEQSAIDYSAITSSFTTSNTFILKDTEELNSKYNGVFGARNYPSVRGLNFLFPKENTIEFSNTSCSYDINVELNKSSYVKEGEEVDYNVLYGSTKGGEIVNFSINPNKMISVNTSSLIDACNLSDFNVLYEQDTKNDKLLKASYFRLTYKVVEDDTNTTHSTVTPLLYAIQSTDARIFEYLNGDLFVKEKPKDYKMYVFSANTYNDGEISHQKNTKLIPQFSEFKNQYILYKDNEPLVDSDEDAKKIVYTIKNTASASLMNSSNSVVGYENEKAVKLDNENIKKDKMFLSIGGLRKYVNLSDNLTKSVLLVNIPKIYDISSINMDSCIFSGGNSDKDPNAIVPGGIDYTYTEVILDLTYMVENSNLKIEEVVSSFLAKMYYQSSVFLSSNIVVTYISNTKIKLTIHYYNVKFKKGKGGNQEIYLKMYNDLNYCISHILKEE